MKDAIDELEALRAERDAAKADAARLREASRLLLAAHRCIGRAEVEACVECIRLRDALATTDSAEWLAKHDATRLRAALAQEREGRLAAKLTAMDAHCDNEALRAQVDSLTKQLVAATNDAARAELRARDLADALREHMHVASSDFDATFGNRVVKSFSTIGGVLQVFDGVPDSDARLREVMGRVALRAARAGTDDAGVLRVLIDEVLGKLP